MYAVLVNSVWNNGAASLSKYLELDIQKLCIQAYVKRLAYQLALRTTRFLLAVYSGTQSPGSCCKNHHVIVFHLSDLMMRSLAILSSHEVPFPRCYFESARTPCASAATASERAVC